MIHVCSLARLHDTVTDTYDPNYVNSVVVLTDGTNDDPDGGEAFVEAVADEEHVVQGDAGHVGELVGLFGVHGLS